MVVIGAGWWSMSATAAAGISIAEKVTTSITHSYGSRPPTNRLVVMAIVDDGGSPGRCWRWGWWSTLSRLRGALLYL